MQLNRDQCEAAVAARDTRFDGVFYTAVTSTGIYCRPSCPAMTPNPAKMEFFSTAAAAVAAGFRACRRCRPDIVPGSPEWDLRADVVGRALRLITDGAIDRGGVAGLAAQLGYSSRQLQRLIRAEFGVGPLLIARVQRAATARILIETTDLQLAEVAFAAGFGSVRSFNETIQQVFALSPKQLRRPGSPVAAGAAQLSVRLALRTPWQPQQLFGHLVATAIPGVEEWSAGRYRRTLRLPGGPAVVELEPRTDHVQATFWLSCVRDLQTATARVRRLLDLDADPVAVAGWLSSDPALSATVARAPGRRVPRSVEAAELALRAVLGQQVSTAAARSLGAALVTAIGDPLPTPTAGLTHLFPSAQAVAELPSSELPLPGSRHQTLTNLAAALTELNLDGMDWAEARVRLGALPGIGPWTTEMIAMRALGDPDAFPAGDLGVKRGAAALGIEQLGSHAEKWRPWRAYAVQYLWASYRHPINQLPKVAS